MLLFSLLLFVLFILPFLDFSVRFPVLFTVKKNIALRIHAVRYFRKTVVAAPRAKFYLVLCYIKLFPAKVALPDESSYWRNHSSIQWDQLYPHVGCYVLNCKISADQGDFKFLLLFLLLFVLAYGLFLLCFILKVSCMDFSHFFVIVAWCYPTFLIIKVAISFFLFFLFVLWHLDPAILIAQGLFSVRLFILFIWAFFLDRFFLLFYDFLNDWERLFSKFLSQAFFSVQCMS